MHDFLTAMICIYNLYKKSNLLKIELHIFFFILRSDYDEFKKN